MRPANASAGTLPAIGAAPGGQAALIPLDQIATIRRSVGPLTINRQAQQPAVTLSFNLPPDVSIGQAVEAIQKLEREVGMPPSAAHQLLRHGAAVPGFAQGPGAAAARRRR